MARKLVPGRRRTQGKRCYRRPHESSNPGSRGEGGSYGSVFANGRAFFVLQNLILRLRLDLRNGDFEAGQDLDIYDL